MKWKFMANTVIFLKTFFDFKELPVNAEKKEVDFSADQEKKLIARFGVDYVDNLKTALNQELKAMHDDNLELKAMQDEIDAMVALSGLTAEELKSVPTKEDGNQDYAATIKAISEKQAEHTKLLTKVLAEGIGDQGKVIDINKNKMHNHSATHLNASNEQYDLFERRSWNEKAAGLSAGSSNFNDKVDIPLLQGDIEHFVRKNPTSLESIFNDFETLPTDWAKLSGIVDRVVSGLIAPSELTQGNNNGWNPKGELLIDTETGQVYDKKIDITLTGEKLKSIEKSWLSYLNGSDGSHPWKTTFVGFLLSEYIKQVALDSRIAQVNGIYVKNPKEITGANINSQNGIRVLWYYFRDVVKQYTAFDMGDPTKENIVDYIKEMIERIPHKERHQQGYEIQLSNDLLLWYRERAGEFYTLQYATDLGKTKYDGMSPLNYPNYKFQPLIDQTNTLFIGITKSKNVENLQYLESEKSQFTVTQEKRDTNMFADFKEGIRFIQVGRKLEAGDPKEFEYQRLYSNSCPVFASDVRVPYFDKGSSIINLKFPEFFPHIEIVQNDYSQNITQITGAVPGQIVTVTGNASLAAARTVVNNANLLLTAAFNLNNGGTLTLICQDDLKLKEVFRTGAPALAPVTTKTFSTGVIDAKSGMIFNPAASIVANLAITSIINGSENKTIQINGTDTAGVDITLSDTGNINVASAVTLATSANYIQMTLLNGVWYETKRV